MEDQGYECRYFWDQIRRDKLNVQLNNLSEAVKKRIPVYKAVLNEDCKVTNISLCSDPPYGIGWVIKTEDNGRG